MRKVSDDEREPARLHASPMVIFDLRHVARAHDDRLGDSIVAANMVADLRLGTRCCHRVLFISGSDAMGESSRGNGRRVAVGPPNGKLMVRWITFSGSERA